MHALRSRYRAAVVGGVLASIAAAGSAPARAQCPLTEHQRLLSGEPLAQHASGRMGTALDQQGTRLVVGAPREALDEGGNVHVFEADGGGDWVLVETLRSSGPIPDSRFGSALELDGDFLIVGAPHTVLNGMSQAGHATVFQDVGGSWVPQALTASDAEAFASYGADVALDGTTCVVGAPAHGPNSDGQVYVYEFDGSQWNEVQILPVPVAGWMQFGTAVDLEDGCLVVGAPRDTASGTNAGAVYVYEHDGQSFVPTQTLLLDVTSDAAKFGQQVVLKDGELLVGAPRDASRSSARDGSASFYRREAAGFVLTQKLIPPDDIEDNRRFGQVVDLRGDRALVTAPWDDGRCVLYRRVGGVWEDWHRLKGDDRYADDECGSSARLGEDQIFVGASGLFDDGASRWTGAAYVYELPDIVLALDPADVHAGDDVDIRACHGLAAGLLLLVVVDLDGQPLFLTLRRASFDAAGEFGWTVTVPPGLSGLNTTLRGFGFASTGQAAATNPRQLRLR